MRQAEWGEVGGGTVGSYGEEQQGSSAVKCSSSSCLWVGPLPASRRRRRSQVPTAPPRPTKWASKCTQQQWAEEETLCSHYMYVHRRRRNRERKSMEGSGESLPPPSSTAPHCTDGSPPVLASASEAGRGKWKIERGRERGEVGGGGREEERRTERGRREAANGCLGKAEREREAPSPLPPHVRTCAPCNTRTRRRTRSRGEARRIEGEKWLSFFPAPTLSLFLGTNSEGRKGRKLRNRATERERALGGAKGGARRRRLALTHCPPPTKSLSLSRSFSEDRRKEGMLMQRKGGVVQEQGPLRRRPVSKRESSRGGGGAERALRKRGPKER